MSLSNLFVNDTKAIFKNIYCKSLETESQTILGGLIVSGNIQTTTGDLIATTGSVSAVNGDFIGQKALLTDRVDLDKQASQGVVDMATPVANVDKVQGFLALDFASAIINTGLTATLTVNNADINASDVILITKGPFTDATEANTALGIRLSIETQTNGSFVVLIHNQTAGGYSGIVKLQYLCC